MSENINQEVSSMESLKPKTENELIKKITDFRALPTGPYSPRLEEYWWIGQTIMKYYGSQCGEADIIRLSESIGIEEDNLVGICEFATKFTQDQLKRLVDGCFRLHWYQVIRNLDVDPDKFIEIYEDNDEYDFDQDIKEFKKRNNKTSSTKDFKVSSEFPEQETDNVTDILHNDKATDKKLTDTEISQYLQVEGYTLIEDLHNKENSIKRLRENITGLNRKLEYTEFTIDNYDRHLSNIREMVEDNVSRFEILEYLRSMEENIEFFDGLG